jgi:hypothetical protein
VWWREAVEELLNEEADTQQEVADILGVSQRTVSDDLAELLPHPSFPSLAPASSPVAVMG